MSPTLTRPLAIAALLAGSSLLAGCGSDSGLAADGDATAAASTSTSAEATPSESATPGGSGTISATEGECAYVNDNNPSVEGITPPPGDPTVSGTVDATIATSIGDLAVTLDADATPCTVNSFVSLAEQGYFDGTTCHRLTTQGIFVLQCGDPTGTGMGGPGYTIPDELSGGETYPAGTLAMAKTAYPNSGGSQFFIVYADTPLPPEYTVFGTVDPAGVKLVAGAAKDGTDGANGPGDGHPTTPVDITSVTVG